MARRLHVHPARPALVGLAFIGGFALFLTLWSLTAPVSGAAIAEGNLQVRSQRQSVQHPYGGVVASLAVVEGQTVQQGQVLIRLTGHEARAKLNVLLAERASLRAQEARLTAERDGAERPAWPAALSASSDEGIAQAMSNETALMAARKRQFEAQVGMLHAKIAQLRAQIAGSRAQVEGLQRQRELLEDEARGARQLLASGFTPKTRVLALERNAAQLEADKAARQSEAAGAEQAISEAELNIARTERERISEITSQLKQVQASLAETGPKVEAAEDIVKRLEITAPVAGEVVGLTVFTEGGVIGAGAKLLDIIPHAEPLIVDARLQLNDIGDVKRNQPADVRLVSIPRQERPRLRGEIVTVSADKLTDEKSGKGFYSLRVALNADDVKDSRVSLQAGMPTEVVVTTRPRTLVEYLVGPLADEISGAFREK